MAKKQIQHQMGVLEVQIPKFELNARVKIMDKYLGYYGKKGIIKNIKYLSKWGNIYTVEVLDRALWTNVGGLNETKGSKSLRYSPRSIHIDFHESKLQKEKELDQNQLELIAQRAAKQVGIEYIGVFIIFKKGCDYEKINGNLDIVLSGYASIWDEKENLCILLPDIAVTEE